MIATIEQGEQKDKRRPAKGRVVSAEVLCYVTADGLWSGGETDTETIVEVQQPRLVVRELGIEVVEYPVDQEVDGPWPAAGHRRNARMVDVEEPKRVLAFSVSGPPEMTRGTGHCAGYAWRLRVPVFVIPPGARP